MIPPLLQTSGSCARATRAFTLLEILIAITVLVLVLVMLVQMTGAVSSVVNRGNGQLDAVSQARFAFDHIGIDIEKAARRPDVADAFSKLPGNDEIKFYSAVSGYSGDRSVSLVHYRVNPTSHQLERGVWGTLWNASASTQNMPLVFGTATTLPSLPNSSDYEVLGQGIFRMEFYWVLKPSGVLTTGSYSLGSSNVAALTVRLAVVDVKSLKLLTQNALSVLVAPDTFSDLTMQDATPPGATWTINVDSLVQKGIPRSVAQSVRVFERTYYVDP